MERRLVVVGASAGGLNALEAFFREVPSACQDTFIVVQHLAADHESALVKLLKPHANLPVIEATEALEMEPGSIYACPPGKIIRFDGKKIHLDPRSEDDKPGTSLIDLALESASTAYGESAVAVILSGTGADGTAGCRMIRDLGGQVAVQSPGSAEFSGMPKSVISASLADVLAPVDELWQALADFSREKSSDTVEPADGEAVAAADSAESAGLAEYENIFEYLNSLFGIDFNDYRLESVGRRIGRRMGLLALPTIKDYTEYLISNREEAASLYKDLLIGVTDFFRDPDWFVELGRDFIEPQLRKTESGDFRVWVAGCATGEEAYSIYMLVDEAAAKVGFKGKINIFATDAFKRSIEIAGQGVYGPNDLKKLSTRRQAAYFEPQQKGYFKIRPAVRKQLIFAQHNFLIDPPFINMDLVCCRNALIYLKPEVQTSAMQAFHYALKKDGILFLGASESSASLEDEFKVESAKARIFRKTGAAEYPSQFSLSRSKKQPGQPAPRPTPATGPRVAVDRNLLQAYDTLLSQYLRAGFLINRQREVLHFFGTAADYCLPLQGRADNNILNLVDGDLKTTISALSHRCMTHLEPASLQGMERETANGTQTFDIVVEPLPDAQGDVALFLVKLMDPVAPVSVPPQTATDEEAAGTPGETESMQVSALKAQLRHARENLEAGSEELQMTKEELHSSNESLQVSNEELQSSNEELHSINEELMTMNAEFEEKNAALVELNRDHENLLNSSEDGVLFVDHDLKIRKFNPAIADAFHLLPVDIGRPLTHIAYKLEDREQMLEDVQTVLSGGERIERESEWIDERIYLKRVTPYLNSDGQVDGVLLSFTDITRSKTLQKHLDFAIYSAGMSWWEWDILTGQLEVSAIGNCLLGFSCPLEDGSYQAWMDRVHPDDRAEVETTLAACVKGETSEWKCEHRFENVTGEWRWVYNRGVVQTRDGEHRAIKMMGTTQDISDVTKAEHGLKAQFNLSPDFLAAIDFEGKFLNLSPSWSRQLGWTEAELIGNPILELLPPEGRSEFEKVLQQATAGKTVTDFECRLMRKDGTQRWFSWSIYSDRQLEMTHISARDVTRRKRTEAELEEAKHRAEAANRAKTDFLGVMSHELRTPLNPILGFTELLLDESKDENNKEILRMILKAGKSLTATINDILDFSKIESDHVSLEIETFDLEELLESEARFMFGQIEASEQPLQIKLEEVEWEGLDLSEATRLKGDPTKLARVLRNLIGNAIKFTPQGSVTLRARVQRTAKNAAKVTIEVEDGGIGISPENINKLFQPFSQIDTSHTRRFGGSGLGLAICRRLVELMGGEITVRSELGKGSVFSFWLPLECETQIPKYIYPPENAVRDTIKPFDGNPKVLLVEDNQSNALYMQTLLARLGCRVELADSGESVFRDSDLTTVQLLLLDIHMPGMGGLEVLRRIRAEEAKVQRDPLPIVMLTADIIGSVKDDCLRLGADEFLSKPTEIKDVRAVLEKFL